MPSYSYSYSYASCVVTKLGNGFQAEILAQYKPSINATLLIRDLKQVEDTAAKALQYFNSTRHTIFYYEDMVKNRTVRQTKPLRLKPHLWFILIPSHKTQCTSIITKPTILIVLLQKLVDVMNFLKVPQRDLMSRQVKIHKGSLSEQIKNWDDVLKTLKGTHYESFLQPDYQI